MKVKVKSFAGFRHMLGKERDVELVEGSRIEDLLEALMSAHEGLRSMLFDDGLLREDLNIMHNGRNIISGEGLRTMLLEGDELALFPAAIGG